MRFRYIKNAKLSKDKSSNDKKDIEYATISDRIKAFITDSFLIAMPPFYIVIYLVFDGLRGANGVEAHRLLAWSYILMIIGVVYILFLVKSGQTPGMKAYELRVVENKTKQKPSFISALLRFIFFNIAFFSVVGLFVSFFRKDRRSFSDLLSNTSLVKEESIE